MSRDTPLTITAGALRRVVDATLAVVATRNTIPILSNILLRTQGSLLEVRGTDLDMEATASADCGGEIDTTVPARLLGDILRKLPAEAQVAITPDPTAPERLVLRSGRSRFTLNTLPAIDFPSIAEGDYTARFSLPAGDLAGLLAPCQMAICTEETRYYLNGVYLHTAQVEGEVLLTAVATDGHRLARLRMMAPAGASGMPGVIVPRKTVEQMLRDMKSAAKDEVIDIAISPVKIRYASPRLTLVSKLIDGTFPDYTRVIPTANDKRLVVDHASLAAAVDRVSTISSERGRAVKVEMADDKLTLSVNNPDAGAATEELEAEYDGAPLTIGFNASYLKEILDEIASDTVLVLAADPASPTLLQSRAGAPALFVLMPMRV